jgi:chaperonin GroES
MSLDKLAQLNKEKNVCNILSDEELIKLGNTVIDEFEADLKSRAEWEAKLIKIMKIAKQVFDTKNTPWPNAANVKFPLITTASIQFASRNLPEIIQRDKVVRFNILPDDDSGMYAKIANAIERHMSYQLLAESNHWQRVVDKLLHILPVVGTAYTKVYYDPITRRKCIDVCTPETIIVNDDVQSLDTARRVSHVLYLHKNDIISGINKGIYSDIVDELGDPPTDKIVMTKTQLPDPDGMYEFIEQHRYLDLDEDGYQEPYIVLVDRHTRLVLRIYNRWDMDKVIIEDDKLIHIEPVQYFTDWHFIPSPDGKFHSIGFGSLLFPINESINTLINQLIDSGTLNNMQSGIIGRGIRIKGGALRPKMGEFIVADATDGTSLKDNVFPFPTKEPSSVLFQLLGLLIQNGEKLSAVTDIMTGQEQAQNAPATTILALEEQGLKVFTAIQMRVFLSLKADMEKLFRLNRIYFDNSAYSGIKVEDLPLSQNDYILADRFDISPVFDPNIATDMKRLMRAQSVIQLVQMGLIQGPGAAAAKEMFIRELRFNEAQVKKLLEMPPPQVPIEQKKLELDAHNDHVMAQIEAGKLDNQSKEIAVNALVQAANAKSLEAKAILQLEKARNEHHLKKVQVIADMLGKVDPEKGVTMSHVNSLIDKLFGDYANEQINLSQEGMQ